MGDEISETQEAGKDTNKYWKVPVDPRLDRLAKQACEVGSYSSLSEFIRATVRRRIKELMPDTKL